jgi:hypothetical protein
VSEEAFLAILTKGHVKAIATACASVKKQITDKDAVCKAAVAAGASVITQAEKKCKCSKRNKPCGGRANEPATFRSCCDSKQHCVRKNKVKALCRDKTTRTPKWWDGSLVKCSA